MRAHNHTCTHTGAQPASCIVSAWKRNHSHVKGTRLSLILRLDILKLLPKLLQSLSGLLSFLAAALAQKYVLQVLPSSCATFS